MRAFSAALLCGLAGCGSCTKGSDAPEETSPPTALSAAQAEKGDERAPAVVAETLPRCRLDSANARLAIPGDDVLVGEAAVAKDALYIGVVRRVGSKRLSGVVKASLDLARLETVDLGLAFADDPPPTPRLRGDTALVTSLARGAGGTRHLEIARIEAKGPVVEAVIPQQADESLAYDVAWPAGGGPGLAAWDEDAPKLPEQLLPDRGVIRVQLLGAPGDAHEAPDAGAGRVASPDKSDAEAPRLLAKRGGGFVLGWLTRKNEVADDAGPTGAAEGPGERRAYRWVEVVTLDAKGEPTSPVRRVSSDKGHLASFDLLQNGDQIVVLAQDETARIEGAGERVVRFVLDGDRIEASDVVDGGVGHSLADLVPLPDAGHFLSFLDVQEHAHLLGLGSSLGASGMASAEPALDGVRVLGAAPPDVLFAAGAGAEDQRRSELRRFVCR